MILTKNSKITINPLFTVTSSYTLKKTTHTKNCTFTYLTHFFLWPWAMTLNIKCVNPLFMRDMCYVRLKYSPRFCINHFPNLHNISMYQFWPWPWTWTFKTNIANEKHNFPLYPTIRNIATNVASMFTRTCRLFSIVVKSSRLLWHHQNMWASWSQEQPYMKFWVSFPKIYRFQQAKPIS